MLARGMAPSAKLLLRAVIVGEPGTRSGSAGSVGARATFERERPGVEILSKPIVATTVRGAQPGPRQRSPQVVSLGAVPRE